LIKEGDLGGKRNEKKAFLSIPVATSGGSGTGLRKDPARGDKRAVPMGKLERPEKKGMLKRSIIRCSIWNQERFSTVRAWKEEFS